MVPIRSTQPLAALGAYWADHHEATDEQVRILELLAAASALALTHIDVPAASSTSLAHARR